MFTEKEYINANKNTCVNNCICFYLWENKPFSKTIDGIMEYDKKHNYCNPENMKSAILEVLKSMTTEKGVNKFISEFKKKFVRPFYRTAKDFIKGEYETEGLTAQGIADIINQQLLDLA